MLTEDLALLLNELSFKLHKWNCGKDGKIAYRLCIAGFASLERWIKEVKPANSKHLKRIKVGLLNKSKVKLKKRSTNL